MYAGLGILDTMNFIKPDVSTICVGMAASMAAVLLAAGTPGKRMALPNSMVLIHQPSSGVEGQQTDIQIVADETRYMLMTRPVKPTRPVGEAPLPGEAELYLGITERLPPAELRRVEVWE